ncbi:prepilin-type N-terminal cleavage/methylation domain-containing protein [Photobacterium sp. SDRW27]|uniref:type II secretion system protein n=1 Tax=Photobacterium obscurum TaxID=2829490 RepID=UPI00224450CE|nr:type II secretion system protein [Photobacterium obscurum]MCW8329887.1 prepilin-type N-terminal cleavage/methylation domain-containing protein [Photobacterium obscurum]
MKYQRGFTLIELVVVIVLLGIISVTAAPRFLNIQDDARDSAYLSLKGSFQSAVTLFHSKWMIDGERTTDGLEGGDWGYTIYNLHFNKYGYPRISEEIQKCDVIFSKLLPDSSLTFSDDEIEISGSGNGNMCTYTFKNSSYKLRYIEESGEITLIKDSSLS